MKKKCPEGGECRFTPDYEHEPEGTAVSCEKCGGSEAPPSEMELAFRLIESAIDAHPRLARVGGVAGEPQIVMGRLGVTVRIPVKLGGWSSRSKVSEITGQGQSVITAADNLVARLETWWVAWVCGLRS